MTTSTDDAALGAQLAKLIPMLSSDQDGEVAAAARAIGRKLQASGRDWHWLASKVSGRPIAASIRVHRPPSPARPPCTAKTPPGASWKSLTRLQQSQWLSKLESLRWPSESDESFIRTVRRDFRDGRDVLWVPAARKRLATLILKAQSRGHEIWS